MIRIRLISGRESREVVIESISTTTLSVEMMTPITNQCMIAYFHEATRHLKKKKLAAHRFSWFSDLCQQREQSKHGSEEGGR